MYFRLRGERIRYFPCNLHSCLWLVQRNLTEYFVAVDANNMLQLYASMLHERRIIITSGKLSTVSISHSPPRGKTCSPRRGRNALRVLARQYLHTLLIYGFNLALGVQRSDLWKAFAGALSQVNYFFLSEDERFFFFLFNSPEFILVPSTI